VVEFSVRDTLDLFDLTYVDVLVSIAMELFRQGTKKELRIEAGVLEHIRQFADEITREEEHGRKKEFEVGGDLSAAFAKLIPRFRQESSTRDVVPRKVSRRLSDLFSNIEILSKQIQLGTGKRLLIIVDGLDKPDLAKATEIFYRHASSLSEPPVSIIYTFSSALRHDPNFLQIVSSFGRPYVLPNVKVLSREGKPDEGGRKIMREILLKRIVSDLLPDESMERLVSCSSGIPGELIALARLACIEAIKNKREQIQLSDVERAIGNRRVDYDVLLDSRQRELLRTVHADRRIENDEEHRVLLHTLSVIEFRNGDVWYDVNPLVEPLLSRQESSGESDSTTQP
jgi:hypothetical protein